MNMAALIRGMAAAGAPPEAIALAVEAIEEAQAGLASTRSAAAERKRRQRERDRDKSRDSHVTVTADNVTSPAPSPSPNEYLNPNPTPTRESIIPAREAEPVLPVGASAEQWTGFVEMRRRIRKPMTARAQQLALRKLQALAESGQPPGAVLDQSTLNNWQDLFPIKETRNGHRDSSRQNHGKPNHLYEAFGDIGRSEARQPSPNQSRGLLGYPALD